MLLLLPLSADGRGLHFEPAPWYVGARADSGLSVIAAAIHVDAETHATLFPLMLAPIRRGPLEFAASWSYVVLRTAREHVFGFGDPKVFARMPVVSFGDSLRKSVSVHGELMVRVPTANAKLFPYASGGQDIELMGTLSLHRLGLHLGAGRIWAEPPSNSSLGSGDLPHTTHAWFQLSQTHGRLTLGARGDALSFEIKDTARGVLDFSLAYATADGLDVIVGYAFETSDENERLFDRAISLRFATRLR